MSVEIKLQQTLKEKKKHRMPFILIKGFDIRRFSEKIPLFMFDTQ